MTELEKLTYERLDKAGVKYEVTHHEAMFTMEELQQAGICKLGTVCKNLFLRDAKGRRHFLVVTTEEKAADMKQLAAALDSTRLSFGSDERLMNCLKLTKGSVTPLGVLNDENLAVEVAFDKDLEGKQRLGFHPCINTATVWMSFDDIYRMVKEHGNSVKMIEIKGND